MSAKALFFTGAGGFIGKYILRHYLDETDCDLYLLEHGDFRARLEGHIDAQQLGEERRGRIHVLEGDITVPGLGLEPAAAEDLKGRVTRAIHLAALYDLCAAKEPSHRINVDGTRNVLEFLAECEDLERFAYMSTIAISGTYSGTYTEDDFDVGQGFKNHYDETKYLAEKLVREYRDRIPTVIFRPTIVVGDSKTGAFEKIDGPYHALTMITRNLHLAVQNGGATKNHMVPIDYVADAFYALFEDEASVGGVFQLGDPNPITYNEFFDRVCAHWGKMKPLLKLPPAMIRLAFLLPFFEKITGVTYESFQYSFLPIDYGTSKAVAALEKHGITCPPVSDYLPAMLDYFRERNHDPHLGREM